MGWFSHLFSFFLGIVAGLLGIAGGIYYTLREATKRNNKAASGQDGGAASLTAVAQGNKCSELNNGAETAAGAIEHNLETNGDAADDSKLKNSSLTNSTSLLKVSGTVAVAATAGANDSDGRPNVPEIRLEPAGNAPPSSLASTITATADDACSDTSRSAGGPLDGAIRSREQDNAPAAVEARHRAFVKAAADDPAYFSVTDLGLDGSDAGVSNVVRMGSVHVRGSLKRWRKRFVVLRRGLVCIYAHEADATENPKKVHGLVILHGCVVTERPRKDKTFALDIKRPDGADVYSLRGLDGERLISARASGNYAKCSFRFGSRAEVEDWTDSISLAAEYVPPEFEANLQSMAVPPPTPISTRTKSIQQHEEVEDGTESFSSNDFDDSASTTDNSILLDGRLSLLQKATRHRRSSSFDGVPSLLVPEPTVQPDMQTRHRRHNSMCADILEADAANHPPPMLSYESDEDTIAVEVPPLKVDESSKLTSDGRSVASDELVEPGIAAYHEGWLDCKLADEAGLSWSSSSRYHFVTQTGLLSYFASDTASDCLGLIDLSGGCKITVDRGDQRVFKIMNSRGVRLIQLRTSDAGDDRKGSDTTDISTKRSVERAPLCIFLRADTWFERNDWVRKLQIVSQMTLFVAEDAFLLPRIPVTEREEKCHWLNCIIARYFSDLRQSDIFNFLVRNLLQSKIARIARPNYVGPILLRSCDFGTVAPQLDNVVMQTSNNQLEMFGEATLLYSGGFILELETEVYVNWSKTKRLATVPVVARAKIREFNGRVYLYGPPTTFSRFSLSFCELPCMELDVEVIAGDKRRRDVSKIGPVGEFIQSAIRRVFARFIVHPNRVTFALPMPGRKLDARPQAITGRARRRPPTGMSQPQSGNDPDLGSSSVPRNLSSSSLASLDERFSTTHDPSAVSKLGDSQNLKKKEKKTQRADKKQLRTSDKKANRSTAHD